LLSNERINREVLKALKQWDTFVFKSVVDPSSALTSDSPKISPSHWKSSGVKGGFDILRDKLSQSKNYANEGMLVLL
jgi:hypothetical protein